MELLFAAMVVVLLLFVFFKIEKLKEEPKEEPRPRWLKKYEHYLDTPYTSRILSISSNPTRDLGQAWRLEPATERQMSRITDIVSDVDVRIPEQLTKGQASDIIGLFESPREDELEVLRFFKVPKPEPIKNYIANNQTEVRWEIHELLTDPIKAQLWEERPATNMQKNEIRVLGCPSGKRA